MKLNHIIDQLKLQAQTPSANVNVDVSGGYVSDLLSDVMANAKKGTRWVEKRLERYGLTQNVDA